MDPYRLHSKIDISKTRNVPRHWITNTQHATFGEDCHTIVEQHGIQPSESKQDKTWIRRIERGRIIAIPLRDTFDGMNKPLRENGSFVSGECVDKRLWHTAFSFHGHLDNAAEHVQILGSPWMVMIGEALTPFNRHVNNLRLHIGTRQCREVAQVGNAGDEGIGAEQDAFGGDDFEVRGIQTGASADNGFQPHGGNWCTCEWEKAKKDEEGGEDWSRHFSFRGGFSDEWMWVLAFVMFRLTPDEIGKRADRMVKCFWEEGFRKGFGNAIVEIYVFIAEHFCRMSWTR